MVTPTRDNTEELGIIHSSINELIMNILKMKRIIIFYSLFSTQARRKMSGWSSRKLKPF
jgi:hypothetical protein